MSCILPSTNILHYLYTILLGLGRLADTWAQFQYVFSPIFSGTTPWIWEAAEQGVHEAQYFYAATCGSSRDGKRYMYCDKTRM